MDLWMYLVVIGMFLIAIVATVWITLWTIQRGERARSQGSGNRPPATPPRPASADETDRKQE